MKTNKNNIEELWEILKIEANYFFEVEKDKNLFNLSFNTVDYMKSQLKQFEAIEYEKTLVRSRKKTLPCIETALSCSQMLNLYNLIVSAEELEKIYEAMSVGNSGFAFSLDVSQLGKIKLFYTEDDEKSLYMVLSKQDELERVKTVLSALTFKSSQIKLGNEVYRGNGISESTGRVNTIILENRHQFSLTRNEIPTTIDISDYELRETYHEVLKWIDYLLNKMREFVISSLLSSQRLVHLILNIDERLYLNKEKLESISTSSLVELSYFLKNPGNLTFEESSVELKNRINEIEGDII